VDNRYRLPQAAAAAVTRLLIESTDETGRRGDAVGISPTIIDAAYAVPQDAIVDTLLRAKNGA